MPGARAGGGKGGGGGLGKSTRQPREQQQQPPYLSVVADICTLEADPEAVSVFFKGNAAITVRVDVVCGRDVIATARSRTLMNFEDDVNCKVRVALSKEQYEQMVLENAPADANDGAGGNHLRFSVMSVGQEVAVEGSQQEHAGASQPIPFLDQLDGLCLPTSEPEHPREYELRLQKKPQALLMVKLWVDSSADFEGVDAGFAAVEEKGSHADAEESMDGTGTNQPSSNGRDRAATAESSSSRRQQGQQQPGLKAGGARDETALERVARQLGIDAAREPELLWIAREALETPPPPFWVEIPVVARRGSRRRRRGEEKLVDEDEGDDDHDGHDDDDEPSAATVEFLNLRTGARSSTNPIINYFEQLTAKERQRIGDAISVEQHHSSGGDKNSEEEEEEEAGGSRPSSEPAPETTWVRVGDGTQPGSRYFFNFQSREKIEHKEDLPQHAQVVEALPSLVEPYRSVVCSRQHVALVCAFAHCFLIPSFTSVVAIAMPMPMPIRWMHACFQGLRGR